MADSPAAKRRRVEGPTNQSYLSTYRIRGIPLECERHGVIALLGSHPHFENTRVVIGSLATEVHRRNRTATVTFDPLPEEMKTKKTEWEYNLNLPDSPRGIDPDSVSNVYVTIDSHFLGITTLHEPKFEHKLDCVAISGLGGHAFGSFKERGGNHMWLRDSLPVDLPGTRVLIYGFDSHLHDSRSSEDLEDMASTLRSHLHFKLTELNPLKPIPLAFLAHSLGGLVIKEIIIQMTKDNNYGKPLLDLIFGLIFFGVPNRGLDIASLIPMVEGQPNESFLRLLGKESQLLRKQCNEFQKAFYFADSEIFSLFEVSQSRSAIKRDTQWKMEGPYATLVDRGSATHGRHWENEPHHVQALQKEHSELVKFSRHDPCYDTVLNLLRRFEENAQEVIRNRLDAPDIQSKTTANIALKSKNEEVVAESSEKNKLSGEQKECLKSLAYEGMTTRQESIASATSDTGIWYRTTSQFLGWIEDRDSGTHRGLLWIKGKPGSGKSVIMRNMMDHLKASYQDSIILSFFFSARGSTDDQTLLGMLTSVVHQLLQADKKGFDIVLPDFRRNQHTLKSGWVWQAETLKGYLSKVIRSSSGKKIFILVDALDECTLDEAQEVVIFLKSLRRDAMVSQTKLRVCLASRHYPEIVISKCYELITQANNRHDIALYVHTTLDPSTPDDHILANNVVEKASGIFLWAVLTCKKLIEGRSRGWTTKRLQKTLSQIPSKLDDLFSQCFTTIDDCEREKSYLLFQWVHLAIRPITLGEIQYALHFGLDGHCKSENEFRTSDDFLESDDQVRRMILDLSVGLIEVIDTRNKYEYRTHFLGQPTGQILQFIHESVRDFLLNGDGFLLFGSHNRNLISAFGHGRLNRICLNYLSIDEIKNFALISSQYDSSPESSPFGKYLLLSKHSYRLGQACSFFHYAMTNWYFHANFAELQGQELEHKYSVDLFQIDCDDEDFKPIPWVALYDLIKPFSLFSTLDLAARFDLLGLARRILSKKDRVTRMMEKTIDHPLVIASTFGHTSILKLLLENGANVEATTKFDRMTPLILAAINGRDTTVKLLVENGADVNAKYDSDEATVLHAAAGSCSADTINLLLERSADVNAKTESGESVLNGAMDAHTIHWNIVKLLVQNGADVNAKNPRYGRMILHTMILRHEYFQNHIDLFKLLIQKGANVNATDKFGQTPLHIAMSSTQAAENDLKSLHRLLVENGADIKVKDSCGATALHNLARHWSNEGPLRLLDEFAVIIHEKDNTGNTALHEVMRCYGSEATIGILVEIGANVNDTNNLGDTALHLAVQHLDSLPHVRALIKNGVNIHTKDNLGRTALHLTAGISATGEIAETLLELGADVNEKDKHGKTPFYAALDTLHRILLNRYKSRTLPKSYKVESPSSEALQFWPKSAPLETLVKYGADMTARDNSGETALDLARKRFDGMGVEYLEFYLSELVSSAPKH